MKNFTLIFLLAIGIQLGAQAQSGDPLPSRNDQVRFIKFYPNPATTTINFDFNKGFDKTLTFQIFNFLGKKVLEITQVTSRNQVNLNDFSRGVYIFQLRDRSGKVIESGKFQVSK